MQSPSSCYGPLTNRTQSKTSPTWGPSAGTLAEQWGVTTPPDSIVGLGPFVLSSYLPGQRLVFARNPHYWRQDAQGRPLPYLDRLTLEIVPDQNAEMLRLESGQIDFTQTEVRATDYASLHS